MGVDRDELLRLVQTLPEAELPAVLADVRQHVEDRPSRPWPPPWSGMAQGSRPDTAARADELLAEGFGR